MKVALVDYIGYGDAKGNPVGHTLKILKEYGELISDGYEIEYWTPKGYASQLQNEKVHVLPFYSNTIVRGKNVWNNMMTFAQSCVNILYILTKTNADIVWFCNADQFLYMCLGMFGFFETKIVVTAFATQYPKGYHNYFLNKVKNHISLFISSNRKYEEIDNGFFMPDFLFSDKIYASYISEQRENKIVCLGTMSRSKKILEIVQVCNNKNWNLDIKGFFYDKSYYDEIISVKHENIHIENRYLEYKEYLQLLGKAKFCFFNYDEKAYANITSGVLLECIFMNCIPIANNFLLKNMNINGIGFDEIEDIKFDNVDLDQIIKKNKEIIKERYEMKTVKRNLLQRFSRI